MNSMQILYISKLIYAWKEERKGNVKKKEREGSNKGIEKNEKFGSSIQSQSLEV